MKAAFFDELLMNFDYVLTVTLHLLYSTKSQFHKLRTKLKVALKSICQILLVAITEKLVIS